MPFIKVFARVSSWVGLNEPSPIEFECDASDFREQLALQWSLNQLDLGIHPEHYKKECKLINVNKNNLPNGEEFLVEFEDYQTKKSLIVLRVTIQLIDMDRSITPTIVQSEPRVIRKSNLVRSNAFSGLSNYYSPYANTPDALVHSEPQAIPKSNLIRSNAFSGSANYYSPYADAIAAASANASSSSSSSSSSNQIFKQPRKKLPLY